MDRLEVIRHNRNQLIQRAALEERLRSWFRKRDFLEVTTPVILPHSSLEENILPLRLTLDSPTLSREGFLRVSPELSLKKILACGLPRIFELGPCFRNLESSHSPQHLNEFTLLEWYHCGIDLAGMIEEFTVLVAELAQGAGYRGDDYDPNADPSQAWDILSIAEAFRRYAGIDFSPWENWDELFAETRSRGFETTSRDDAFYWLFLNLVEPEIRKRPTIIYEYPIFQASFSQGILRPTSDNPRGLEYGLRFEAYLGGMEICNAFQELVDPVEQERRWRSYLNQHGDGLEMDRDFLTALTHLQGEYFNRSIPVSGIALGWERLLMFLLGAEDIRHIQPLYFNILNNI